MTLSKYKPEYCDLLIKHLSQGYSFESFGATVKCGRSTLYDWCDRHPDFMEAKKIGIEESLKYYERLLQAGLVGADIKVNDKTAKINTTLLIFALKTRFYKIYGDKQQIEHSGEAGKLIVNLGDDNASKS